MDCECHDSPSLGLLARRPAVRSAPQLIARRPAVPLAPPRLASRRVPPPPTSRGLALGRRSVAPGLARGREPLRSSSPVERTAAAVSEAAPVSTETLRQTLRAMGAPPEVTRSPSRRLLVQALGVDAVAAASGIASHELLRRASVSPASAVEASLHVPDAALVDPEVMRLVGWRPVGGAPRWLPTAGGLGRLGAALVPEGGAGSQDGFTTPHEQPWEGSGDTGEPGGSGSAQALPGSVEPIPSSPGAVTFRAGAWDFDEGTYTLQQGDTLCGLGITYLGGMCARGITDIWPLQSFRFTKCPSPTPPSYTRCADGRPVPAPGTRFVMPQEAIDRARRWAAQGKPSAPAGPGSPGYGNDAPGKADKPKPGAPGGFLDRYKWPLLGAGVVAIAAVALT